MRVKIPLLACAALALAAVVGGSEAVAMLVPVAAVAVAAASRWFPGENTIARLAARRRARRRTWPARTVAVARPPRATDLPVAVGLRAVGALGRRGPPRALGALA